MAKISLSIALGLVAPIVVFMAAALVEVPGQNPPQERIAASLAAFLYLAICQFLIARMDDRKHGANWPSTVALCVPLLLLASVADARDLGERAFLYGPWVVAGGLGIAAGAWAATRVTLPTLPLESCRRTIRSFALVLGAVAVVLVAALVPLTTLAGTFPDGAPGAMASVFLVIAGLSALVGLELAQIAARAKRGRSPSFAILGFLALLAFLPGCFLTIPAKWLVGYGPVLRAVGVLSPLCALAELAVAVLLGAMALRLPAAETT